jgi:cellulose synthase/poly-beta-1,6-N-acetylglucosamine synthase-like glycosyltransferase
MGREIVEISFWLAFSLIAYIFWGYPFTLFVLSKYIRPLHAGDWPNELPSITVFIPAYNEEAVIAQKIENTLSLDFPSGLLEIVVASDGSNDGTNKILEQYRNNGVKVFINDKNEGKNAVINKFIPFTKGQVLVFTDANSIFSREALVQITKYFSNPKVGCVGGKLRYLRSESTVAMGEGLYFKYENFIREMEGLHGKMIGANGAIYAIRRDLFVPVPAHVPNDFFHPLTVLGKGLYSVFEKNAIAYEKPSEDQKEEFSRRARIVARSVAALSEVNKISGILKGKGWFYILSHKILRWLAFPLLLIVLILNIFLINKSAYSLVLFVQIIFYLSGILGYVLESFGVKMKFFYIPYYFLLINLAGTFGVFNWLRGKRVISWITASTTR